MKRLFPTFSFAILLIGLVLPAVVSSAEPPPDGGTNWSGWKAAALLSAPATFSGGVLPLGGPQQEEPPPLVENLAAALPDPEPVALALDLGLSTTVAAGSNDLITETARALDYNWAQCYLFVRNQIRFTPCYGFMRGPERTLLDREGSDGDQAFLLLALLRTSGYTATVRYVSPPDGNGNGGFVVPLGGTTSGYDAAAWAGVAATGTVNNVCDAVWGAIGQSRLGMTFWTSSTPQASALAVEHFWVQMTLSNKTYNLDPSFKPRRTTSPRDVLTDMGYTRTNFLAQAGGTATNDWFVRGLASTNIATELRRLSANLSAKWQSVGTNAATSYFIGGDEIISQDLSADTNTFHGSVAGTDIDFLAQSDATKNAKRASLTIYHVGFTNAFWLDEVAARHVWLAYTNASPYPRAVLRVDDAIVATELAAASSSVDSTYISVFHPAVGSDMPLYTFSRATTNVYSIPIGFGGDHRGGMRTRAENELGRMRSAGYAENNIFLRSRVAQLVGQQWLAQTALVNDLDSRIKGSHQHFFYTLGVSGQADSSYVDLKNAWSYSSADPAKFDGYMLFSSALEHGVLDQMNGTNHPAVSTVRIIDLANSANSPIYLATSANWSTIRSTLTNYDQYLSGFDTDIGKGRKILLPKNGQVVLKHWSGSGYIDYGPESGGYSTGMMIGGGLNGGFTSDYGSINSGTAWGGDANTVYRATDMRIDCSPDPVDMQAGASLIDHTDLTLAGPTTIAWTRHYDARLRWTDGPLGRGWSHTHDGAVTVFADPDAFLGRSSPLACVPSVVASAVVADLLASGETANNMSISCLVVKWWTDQLVEGAATVRGTGQALSFARAPDGSYVAAPGVTATFARGTNGQYTLQERLGRTWNFATNGMLSRVTDPSGNFTSMFYTNGTCLVAVSNSFGGKFTVNWSGSRISSVSDTANRSVAYRYSPTGCLTGITDAAGFGWKYDYDNTGAFLAETDPSGALTVSNAVNSLGQTTNQLSAASQRWSFAFGVGSRAWDRDPYGRRMVYEYTDDGRLSRRTERDGTVSAFFYDSQGQVLSNVDAIGRANVMSYDAGNCLTHLTEAANTANARSTDFIYDDQHHLMIVSNALGRTTRLTYDSCHRVTARISPDGTVVTNVYDSHGLPTTTAVLDATGKQLVSSTFAYDSHGFATNISSTDAGSIQYRYDNAGNVTNLVDAIGRLTRFQYDPRGLLTCTVNAATGRTVRTFTSSGRPAATVDALNRTNTFVWTPGGLLAATRYPNGGIVTNEFDAASRLSAATDIRGTRVSFGFDLMDRVTNRATTVWQTTAWYDNAGCVTTRLNAVNGRTDTRYDSLNRPVAITDPLRYSWTNNFDAQDTLTSTVDPKLRTKIYSHDLMQRRNGITYPSGRTESFAFDALGRMIAFTNSEGHAYRLTYDGQGRLVAATNAMYEAVFRNYFDPCGNLTNKTDGASRPINYQRDVLNRCTNTVYSDGSSEAFTFDSVGNLLTAKNATTTNAFGYSSMNSLTSAVSRMAGVAFTNLYRYDLGGLATNVVYPGGKTVQYAFDPDGNVTNVTDWSNHTWRITRDAAGRISTIAYPNYTSGTWGFDASGAVTNWAYSGAAGLPGRSIKRDSMGLKTSETKTSGQMPVPATNRRAVNTFNTADRLTSAQVGTGTNPVIETYLYDKCGALTNIVYSGGGEGAQSAVFSYDLAGRMTAASASNLNFSASYDALGNRNKTVVNATTNLWVIDYADPLKRPLMETTTNGTPVRYYVWGAGTLLAVIDANGTTRYAHCDELGSVVALTSASTNAAVLFTANYGPYGEPWGTTGTNATPFGWLGGRGVFHAGGTSLYLTSHRAYDTTIKRFLSQDPIGLGGGANLYAYCLGNPLAYTDAFGYGADPIGWVADNVFNAQAVSDSYNFMAGADRSTADGWCETVLGAVGLAANVVDAGFNLIPGKGEVEAEIKTGIKEVAKILTEDGAKDGVKEVVDTGLKDVAKDAISTGRTAPNSLKEQLAMEEVMANPIGTTPAGMPAMSDAKNGLFASDGWVKRVQNVNGVEIHYVENLKTGQVLDFKFKN